MAGIKLEGFQGLIPRSSPRLLPAMAATAAKNTKLLNGEIRGFRQLRENQDFTSGSVSPVMKSYRVVDSDGLLPDGYLNFDSRDVDVIRSPLVNDSHDRYYWAGDGVPKMNTQARILNGDAPFWLGIPTPTTAPTVTPPAGTDEARAYVYTFVSAYGEEGQPSPPTVATGDAGTWALSSLPSTVPDAANRNVTLKRIYRTVSGGSSSNYYWVADIPIGDTTYDDTATTTEVASNNLLESTTWAPPPSDMEGFVVMPGGYMVGWVGRRIVMSEAYRPHAWPVEYELSSEFDVVGLIVWASTLVIGTQSQPYFGQGQTPASFTMQKMDAVEPCLSRNGMVGTVVGAYYPSPNGLVLANSGGVTVITRDLLTMEEWAAYNPENLFATQLGLQYVAFNSASGGLIFNPTEPQTKLIELEGFVDVDGIGTDKYTGNVQVLANNKLWDWDPAGAERMSWRWKSKVYQTPKPVNFGAVRLNFLVGDNDVSDDVTDTYQPYNTALFAAAPMLAPLGYGALGGSPANPTGLVTGWTEAENRQPLGGSLLYPIVRMSTQGLTVRFIVHLRDSVVFDKVIASEAIVRLPTGFKSDIWQFELIGNTDVYSVQIAETPKQLAEI